MRKNSKTQKVKHWRSADLVSECHAVGYELKQYPGDLAFSVEVEEKSSFALALQNEDLKPRTSSLMTLL